MASQGAYNWGTLRHYWPTGQTSPAGIGGEGIHFSLIDGAGARVPAVSNTQAQVDIIPLDIPSLAYTKDITLGGLPDGQATWVHISDGFYRLRLYGRGVSAPHDRDLIYTGRYSVNIKKTGTGNFESISGFYDVRGDWDVDFACTYVPGSSGDDAIKGCVDVFHWWNRERVDPADAGLSEVELSLRDVAGTNWLSVKKSLSEFTIVNQHLWFNKTLGAGIPAGEVLLAEVKTTYRGIVFTKVFPTPVMY